MIRYMADEGVPALPGRLAFLKAPVRQQERHFAKATVFITFTGKYDT